MLAGENTIAVRLSYFHFPGLYFHHIINAFLVILSLSKDLTRTDYAG